MTQDEQGRELAEARAEIAALRDQIAKLQADKCDLELRMAVLHDQLACYHQPVDLREQPIREWLDAQGEWRYPTHLILKYAVGLDPCVQDTAAGRRLAKIMHKLGWEARLMPDDPKRRVKGYIKPRY